jgi:cell filamentation protein
MADQLAFFEERQIRRIWDEGTEKWYFSVIDIVGILLEQDDYKKTKSYRTTLKNRLKSE